MNRVSSEALAAALAAFIAVTSLAGTSVDPAPTTPLRPLAGVGMPGTGPGHAPVGPLMLLVVTRANRVAAPERRELAELAEWLDAHHGRARMQLLSPTRASRLADASAFTSTTRPVVSPSKTLRKAMATPGQHMVVTLDAARRPTTKAALLQLPYRTAAAITTAVPLGTGEHLIVPVDARRPGATAATIARAVISIANLNPAPPGP